MIDVLARTGPISQSRTIGATRSNSTTSAWKGSSSALPAVGECLDMRGSGDSAAHNEVPERALECMGGATNFADWHEARPIARPGTWDFFQEDVGHLAHNSSSPSSVDRGFASRRRARR